MEKKQDYFLKLYQKHHEAFAKYCQFLTRNQTDAEDLMHESLLTCYSQFDQMKDEHAFLKYIIGIARRKFFNIQRRKTYFVRI